MTVPVGAWSLLHYKFFEQAAANAPLTSSVTGQSATRLRSVIITKVKRE